MLKIGCHWQRYNTWVPKQWIVNIYNVFVVVVVLCFFFFSVSKSLNIALVGGFVIIYPV